MQSRYTWLETCHLADNPVYITFLLGARKYIKYSLVEGFHMLPSKTKCQLRSYALGHERFEISGESKKRRQCRLARKVDVTDEKVILR